MAVVEPAVVTVGMVACPRLKLFTAFLRGRHYRVVEQAGAPCDMLVVCADDLADRRIRDWGLNVPGPKVVVGADPPSDWRDAHRLDFPILPLQLEQYLQNVRAAQGGAVAPDARKFAVTLVEDDPTIRAAVSSALRAEGFEVRECGGFADFNATIHHGKTDFLVLDLNLPGFSGETLAGFIRKRNIPIGLFSSVPAHELEAVRKRVGAVAAFSKSEPLGNVTRWIREFLERPA